jgi:hypothetical protein
MIDVARAAAIGGAREMTCDDALDVALKEMLKRAPAAIGLFGQKPRDTLGQQVPQHQLQIGRQRRAAIECAQEGEIVGAQLRHHADELVLRLGDRERNATGAVYRVLALPHEQRPRTGRAREHRAQHFEVGCTWPWCGGDH